jgi:hypothetical protein
VSSWRVSNFIYCYAQCHYAECRYAECRSASPMAGLVRQATRHLPAMIKCTIGGSSEEYPLNTKTVHAQPKQDD